MELAWLPPEGWQALLQQAGFTGIECFGWFDRRPYAGGEDTSLRGPAPWLSQTPRDGPNTR